jgi:hypothetical protein
MSSKLYANSPCSIVLPKLCCPHHSQSTRRRVTRKRHGKPNIEARRTPQKVGPYQRQQQRRCYMTHQLPYRCSIQRGNNHLKAIYTQFTTFTCIVATSIIELSNCNAVLSPLFRDVELWVRSPRFQDSNLLSTKPEYCHTFPGVPRIIYLIETFPTSVIVNSTSVKDSPETVTLLPVLWYPRASYTIDRLPPTVRPHFRCP